MKKNSVIINVQGFIKRVGNNGENKTPLFNHPINKEKKFFAIIIENGKKIKVKCKQRDRRKDYSNVVKSIEEFDLGGVKHYFVRTKSSFYIVKKTN